jgi:hypothetical protein
MEVQAIKVKTNDLLANTIRCYIPDKKINEQSWFPPIVEKINQ